MRNNKKKSLFIIIIIYFINSSFFANSDFNTKIFNGIEKLTLVKQDLISCVFIIENIVTQKKYTISFQKDNPAFKKMHIYLNNNYMGMYNPIGDSWHNLAAMLANRGTQIEHLQEISRNICLHINASYKKAAVDYVNPARMGW